MVVNGAVKNNPSDGSERAVANGMMMVVVEPLEQSTRFVPDDSVTTVVSTNVRLGPGANYPVLASVPGNTQGSVVAHSNNLEGVLATGSHWWKVDLGGAVGWVEEDSLAGGGGNPPTGFVVESRAGGLNYGDYSDSRMVDSSIKSTASGTTPGIGSREAELKCAGPAKSAVFSFTPGSSGPYEVFATWAASSLNGNQVEHIVTHDGGSTSMVMDQGSGAHIWNSLGQYNLTASNTYTVQVTNANTCDPNNSSNVFRTDAILWEAMDVDAPPSASIVQPVDGSNVSGSVTIQVNATDAEDAQGSLQVEVSLDGGGWQTTTYNSTSSFYELSWDTTPAAEGSHTLDARAIDSASNMTNAAQVTVTVDNLDDPPTASIVSPTQGSTVFGVVTIEVDAGDDRDAEGTLTVEVSIDAEAWQATTYNSSSALYELVWDTTAASDGPHTIDARATDSALNTANAGQLTVTVDNSPPEELHVGDLDGASTSAGRNWQATVTATVHDTNHSVVANATVSGSWSGGFTGPGSCTTDGSGQCSITSGNIRKRDGSATFTVEGVTHATLTYQPADNHDPDADSAGTQIIVSK
jgi:hypothetical protein